MSHKPFFVNNIDLIQETLNLLPENGWGVVKQTIVSGIVDNMPGETIQRLTGKYDDFEKAEEFLFNYYELPDMKIDLLVDGFKLIGAVECLEMLNQIKFEDSNGVSETDPS